MFPRGTRDRRQEMQHSGGGSGHRRRFQRQVPEWGSETQDLCGLKLELFGGSLSL